MPTVEQSHDLVSDIGAASTSSCRVDRLELEEGVRARRLWYHDIELANGLRTRLPEDYTINPVLRRVDESVARLALRLDEHFSDGLSDQSVLDLGCADGKFCLWAARRGAARVLGIERNAHVCRRAQWLFESMGADNVSLTCGPVESLDVDDSYDVVLCLGLLYHLVNPLGTLHRLRQLCTGHLVVTVAVDLDDAGGQPISRLDRYATGAHGLWSYNVPMIRQLLATAGFAVGDERIDDGAQGGRHYFAIAHPADIATHHIFDQTVDEEFPLNMDHRRDRVRDVWSQQIASRFGAVAVFGAGTHTPWLFEQVVDLGTDCVACVMDDRPPVGQTVGGFPVVRPTDIDRAGIDAVIISSWHQASVLQRRAQVLFGDDMPIIRL